MSLEGQYENTSRKKCRQVGLQYLSSFVRNSSRKLISTFTTIIFLLSILFYSIYGMQQRHLVISVTLRGRRTSSTEAVRRNNARMEIIW